MDVAVASSVAVARQPILTARQRLVGYELLHRGVAAYGEQATAQVLVAAYGDIGIRGLVGGRRAWINVSRRFLLDVDPLPLAPDDVVLELLEDQNVDDELLGKLQELHVAGFTIALDDFTYAPEVEDLLALASIVKVDVLDGGVPHAARQAELLKPFGVTLLAEKVEDRETFEACRALGYELFQGYFFCKPEIVRGREIPTSVSSSLGDMAVLSRADATFEEIAAVVARDPGLTLRLLRLLNSAAYSLRRRITSVHDAVTMLGARTVRQWAMLLVLGGISVDCDELVPTALSRAHTLSRLAQRRGDDTDVAFSVGLLSVADALLGVPMADALDGLPLDDAVVAALLDREGPDGAALTAVLDFEWGTAPADPDLHDAVGACYAEALRWSLRTAASARD
ncbi:MAG TPA: HDOD domain-containing protein [Baekduia sp.]|uniref:EAL and HDOD domain-containing protein n=1 Tax=Baekduia sp. TaxID=2600305 RepID=UPI002D7991DD|nr:HDOD domain-containing protein [Baekduia sp.]HET6510147.1 HDOD domain-containing protein [Baekduia sp.]